MLIENTGYRVNPLCALVQQGIMPQLRSA